MAVYNQQKYESSSHGKQMSFSHWSRHDFGTVYATRTDHWSKLRCKSYKLNQLPTGQFVGFCHPQGSWGHQYAKKRLGLPNATVTQHGTLAPVGNPEFNKYLVERLHNPHLVKPRPPKDSRGYDHKVRAPSASSQRAKRGYKYWTDDKQVERAPSSKGCLGSKGTHLGLGVPRL